MQRIAAGGDWAPVIRRLHHRRASLINVTDWGSLTGWLAADDVESNRSLDTCVSVARSQTSVPLRGMPGPVSR